jgi:RHS repeat-associated protein
LASIRDKKWAVLKKKRINLYPFGLKHKGYNNVTTSNGNAIGQKNKMFQGQMLDDDLGLNWYGFKYRNYDPSLARFHNVDPLAEEREWLTPYNFVQNNPINRIDPDGALDMGIQGPDDWVEDKNGKVYWDNNATSQATTKAGETYLGKNVLVGTHNRDSNGNEAVNTARFDLYLESDKTGSTATIMGNTVPSDITKSGTLGEGLYSAKFGHRNKKKYHSELAIRIYNLDGSDGLPTVNGNPNPKSNGKTLTGVLFHMGNNYQTSLFDSRGNAYSHGCQTSGCFPNSRPTHNAFMNKVGKNFKGTYYLRSKPAPVKPVSVPFSPDIPGVSN